MELRLYFQPLPVANITACALPLVRAVAALDSPRSANPAVDCVCMRVASVAELSGMCIHHLETKQHGNES